MISINLIQHKIFNIKNKALFNMSLSKEKLLISRKEFINKKYPKPELS